MTTLFKDGNIPTIDEEYQRGVRKDSNPKSAAATTRLDLSLFPMTATAYGALGMTEGDYKYRGYNYRADGVRVSTYVSAFGRHLGKFYSGEWADSKTGVPHLASMISCIAIIIDGFECGNIKDDRPPKVDMAGLLNRFEDTVAQLQELFPDAEGQVTQVELDHQVNKVFSPYEDSE